MRKRAAFLISAALSSTLGACGGSSPQATSTPSPATARPAPAIRVGSDSASLVPPNFGTIRQDDISIVLDGDGVRVSAIPLDESVIRLLAPDSYRTLHSQLDSKRAQITQRASVRGIREPRVWRIQFFGWTPDARFVPTDFTVTSGGREYRPIDVIALSRGFSEQRLQPRDTQTGLLVFEDGLDVSQPVTVSIGTVRNTDWDWSGQNAILKKLDTERASVRARAASRPH